MTFYVHIAVMLLIVIGLYWNERKGPFRLLVFPAVLAKALGTMGFAFIYYYYYGEGDVFTYLNESGNFGRFVLNDPDFLWYSPEDCAYYSKCTIAVSDEPRVWFFAKLTAVLTVCTHYNYWLNNLWFSLIVFLVSFSAVKRMANRFPGWRLALSVVVFFWPTFVFWSSGYHREGLATSLLFWLLSVVFGQRGKANVLFEGCLVVIASFLLWKLKYYYCALFIATVIAFWLSKVIKSRLQIHKGMVLTGVFLGSLLLGSVLGSLLHPNLSLERLHHSIVENHQNMILLNERALLIAFPKLHEHWGYLFYYTPKALFSGILRPFLWEADSAIQLITAVNNIIVALLLLVGFAGWYRFRRRGLRLTFVAFVMFAFLLLVVLTFSSPNVGSLARYKISCIPVLLVLAIQGLRLWFPPFFYRLDYVFGVNKKDIHHQPRVEKATHIKK